MLSLRGKAIVALCLLVALIACLPWDHFIPHGIRRDSKCPLVTPIANAGGPHG